MNKNTIIFLVVAVVAIILVISAWYSGMFVPKKNYAGVSNVSGTGFSFDYPSYWYEEAPDKLTSGPDSTALAMVYDPKEMTTYCLVSELYYSNRTEGPNGTQYYRILSDRIYNLNGRTAREIIYTYKDASGIEMKAMDVIITVAPGKRFFLIHCNSKIENFEFQRPCFNLIVNSFRIKS